MRVRVYLRPKTVYLLVARKNRDLGWLAEQVGVSQWTVSMMLNGRQCPSPMVRQKIMDTFRGMSHKAGGRLRWDDLFQSVVSDSGPSL